MPLLQHQLPPNIITKPTRQNASRKELTPQLRSRICELRKQGYSYRKIHEVFLDTPLSTIKSTCRRESLRGAEGQPATARRASKANRGAARPHLQPCRRKPEYQKGRNPRPGWQHREEASAIPFAGDGKITQAKATTF